MIIEKNNYFKFESTGNTFYANNNIIGLSIYENEFDIGEGSDGGIDDDDFTSEEKHELADYMIKLWQEYKNSIIL